MESVRDVRDGCHSNPVAVRCRSLGGPARQVLIVGFLAPVAYLLSGCGAGGDLISTMALPSQQTDYVDGVDLPVSPDTGRQSVKPELTPAQRDYLAALATAGIHPSNDLRALSIGAYVCQARAAGQSDETVWDSVAPMVRSEVISASTEARHTAVVADVDETIGTVISIAAQRLC